VYVPSIFIVKILYKDEFACPVRIQRTIAAIIGEKIAACNREGYGEPDG
jgi:hypothetical protein